jgi:hypothetical protein
MTPKIIYNLSNISGFMDLICNKEEDQHYYTSKIMNINDTKFKIINYVKDTLSPDLYDTFGLLRSIVLVGSTYQKVVSFSPQKALSGERFMLKYPVKTDNIIAEDFIEGTMINLFFDNDYGDWQISTRNLVGCENSFYNTTNKTFKQMFNEACVYNNLNIYTLNRKFCYSFVLQHPDNRIVMSITEPKLYLVGAYEIIQNNDCIIVVEENMADIQRYRLFFGARINFTRRYEFSTYTQLIEQFCSEHTPYYVMGIVVKNLQTGERSKFRNPKYEEVKQLRGNQSNLLYHYLTLRQTGRIKDFLFYYPEFKQKLTKYRNQVHTYTNNLFKNYVSCYIKKEKPLKEYPRQFRTNMFKLHIHFINDLKPNKLHINNTEVIKYMNTLEPPLLMFYINV